MSNLLATDGVTALVLLNRGSESMLVDHADLDAVLLVPWFVSTKGHRSVLHSHRISGRKMTVILARLLMEAPAGTVVDHINGDGLDNRRSNLRITDRLGNARNRHGVNPRTNSRGVRFLPWSGRWQARIRANGKSLALGTAATKEGAQSIYNDGVKKYHGEHGRPVTLGG